MPCNETSHSIMSILNGKGIHPYIAHELFWLFCQQQPIITQTIKLNGSETGYDFNAIEATITYGYRQSALGIQSHCSEERITQRSHGLLLLQHSSNGSPIRALFPSRETHGVSSTCGDFITQGEKGRKMRLSQICCKWTIPAKMTHVTLPPLMSPDSISHC